MTMTQPDIAPIHTSSTLLEINNISVDYRAASGTVHALTDVSLSLRRGQVLGLAGESGSGKSTLAYAITRLLHAPAVIIQGQVLYYPRSTTEAQGVAAEQTGRPVSGRSAFPHAIYTEPLDILQLSASHLRAVRWSEVAIVFQSAMNALNPVLDIGTQITDVLRAHRPNMGQDACRLRAQELLRLVGIAPDRIRSYPHELSGGMRQRAIIAIALALSPELIIMDEPTTALDVVVQREILMEIASLRERLNFSVIFITHDLSLLLEIADQIAIMYAGRVVEIATRHELQHQPRHPYSYGLLHSFPRLHGPRHDIMGIPGSPPDLRSVPKGCAFHPRCPLAHEPCLSRLPLLQPSASDTPQQVVACHLYNEEQKEQPNNADFATQYQKKYQAALGVALSDTQSKPAREAQQAIEQPVLEAIHLRKYFPVRQFKLFGPTNAVHAVEDTSLTLVPGRVLALVGESGSGKTTMARMLARLYDPSAGSIKFRGEDVRLSRDAGLKSYRRHVQMVFQDPFASLNAVHNVRHHLSVPLRLYGHVTTQVEETEQVLMLLDRVSLSPAEQFIQKYPHQLSGGQRQRVAIARALAVRPAVLLADEPVSMLDVSIRLDILNLLLRLKTEERLALLFITHDIASARYFADETLVMYAGQTVEGGPSEEVIQQPRHPYTQLLLAAAPDPDWLDAGGKMMTLPARGEIPSLIHPPGGCRFHPRCPHAMPVCRERFPARTDMGGGHWTHCFLYE